LSEKQKISQFDQVRIITTKHVRYLSAPPGTKTDPKGIWSVAAIVGNSDALLTKSNMTICIPISDVLKIAGFGLGSILNKLGKLSTHG